METKTIKKKNPEKLDLEKLEYLLLAETKKIKDIFDAISNNIKKLTDIEQEIKNSAIEAFKGDTSKAQDFFYQITNDRKNMKFTKNVSKSQREAVEVMQAYCGAFEKVKRMMSERNKMNEF